VPNSMPIRSEMVELEAFSLSALCQMEAMQSRSTMSGDQIKTELKNTRDNIQLLQPLLKIRRPFVGGICCNDFGTKCRGRLMISKQSTSSGRRETQCSRPAIRSLSTQTKHIQQHSQGV